MIAKTLKLSVTNCYLLKADHRYVLIDTGYDWEWDTFRKQLDRAKIDFADIEYLILTHHHDDHAGLLNQVVTKNPGIKVVMSKRAKELLTKGRNDRTNVSVNGTAPWFPALVGGRAGARGTVFRSRPGSDAAESGPGSPRGHRQAEVL